MIQQPNAFPQMPEIGLAETFYARLVQKAVDENNPYAQEAAKVSQYISLALNPNLDWPTKTKYFHHALKRHCAAPADADESVTRYFRSMAQVVRQHAGLEALRLASAEDDLYATRLGLGTDRSAIEAEAEVFFSTLLGTGEKRPVWFNEEDWAQLRLIRDQWI